MSRLAVSLLDALVNEANEHAKRCSTAAVRCGKPVQNRRGYLPRLSHGWYAKGMEKTKPADLLFQYWRALVRQKFPASPVPSFPPYMIYLRGHLERWISTTSLETALQTVEYTVQEWRGVMTRYHLAAEYPDLRVIYGFRRSLRIDIDQKKQPRWGARWTSSPKNRASRQRDLEEAYGVTATLEAF
jgi:hypothetical protein